MRFVGAVIALVFLGTGAASAQGVQNYNDIIPGARAGSLGGAFTAVADDSTAVIHNPAGLAHVPDRGLSLSVSAYGFDRTVVKDIFSSSSESVDLALDSLLFYPGATAYVMPLGDEDDEIRHTLAFSILAPRFSDREGVEHLSLSASGIDLDAFQSSVQRMLQAGPSYAFRTGRVSFGASVFVQYATFNEKTSTATSFFFENDVSGIGASRLLDFQFSSGEYFGLTGTLGALVELTSQTRLGLNIQFPSLRLGGQTTTYLAEATSLVDLDASGAIRDVSLYQDVFRRIEGDTDVRTPWVFSLGGSHYFGKHLLAVDVDLFLPIARFDFVRGVDPRVVPTPAELPGADDDRGFDGRVSEPRRNLVVNASIGVDIEASPKFHIMAGLYTDFSSVPTEALESYNQINLYGASFGIRHLGDSSTLTVGLTARYGQGSALGLNVSDRVEITQGPVDARQWSLALLVGGSRALNEDDEDDDEEEDEEANSNPMESVEAREAREAQETRAAQEAQEAQEAQRAQEQEAVTGDAIFGADERAAAESQSRDSLSDEE